jgi:hypothetical protein
LNDGEAFSGELRRLGLVTAGEQTVGEVAFEEHALAEGGLARRFTASQAATAADLLNAAARAALSGRAHAAPGVAAARREADSFREP